jgi:hypothetical protein
VNRAVNRAMNRVADRGIDERGTSLVEVMMTVLLLGIVLAVVYGGIGSLSNAAEGSNVRLQNLDEGRVMMATTTKDIRTATQPSSGASAFVVAKPNELQFYANLDNPNAAASLVHLYIGSSTELVEEYTSATDATGAVTCTQQPCSYLTANKKTRFVGRYVVNDATHPLFTYFDVGGAVLSSGASGLSATQLLQVRSVQVNLLVSKTHAYSASTTAMENTVGLPNIAFQQQAG